MLFILCVFPSTESTSRVNNHCVLVLTFRQDVVNGLWFCSVSDGRGSTESPEAATGSDSFSH